MKKKILLIMYSVAFVLLMFSIASFAQGHSRLSVERLKPVAINGHPVGMPDAFLEINRERTRFTANVGCNDISGKVTENGRYIRFRNIVSTRKFCGQGDLMKNETAFMKALAAVTRFTKQHSNVSFYARGREVVRFEVSSNELPPVKVPVRLNNRKWTLVSIGEKQVGANDAFINFDAAKMSAGGNTGCNVFGGNYSVKGDRLSITGVISTMRACIEDERMTIEREFLDGLQNTDRFEIKSGRLYLYKGRKRLLSFTGQAK